MKKLFKIIGAAFMTCAIAFSAASCAKVKQLTCKHTWDEGTITRESTCSVAGEKKLTCTTCKKTKTEKIETLPHTEKITEKIAPDCEKDGATEGVVCSVCGEVIIAPIVIPATGHVEVKDAGTAAGCLTSGKTDGSHCAICDKAITAQETIPATGHKLKTIPGQAATCEKDGLTDGQVCENCGEVYVEQVKIPAIGSHNYVDGKCSRCGEYSFEFFTTSANYTEVDYTYGDALEKGYYRLYYYTYELGVSVKIGAVGAITPDPIWEDEIIANPVGFMPGYDMGFGCAPWLFGAGYWGSNAGVEFDCKEYETYVDVYVDSATFEFTVYYYRANGQTTNYDTVFSTQLCFEESDNMTGAIKKLVPNS